MAAIERKVAKVVKTKAKPKMLANGPKAGYSQQVRKFTASKSQPHKSNQTSSQSTSQSGSGSSQPLVKAFLTSHTQDQDQDQEYSDTQEWISDNKSVDQEAPILNEGSTWADSDVIADKSGSTWAKKVAAQESSFANRRTDSLPSDFVISHSSSLPASGQ